MLNRYSRKELREIWSDKNKFDTFLKIELLNADALVSLGISNQKEVDKLKNVTYDINRIYELEEITKHDVIAFTRAVSENLGEESKWIHYGLTSTDVVDTANAVLLKQANNIIRKSIKEFIQVLEKKALKYKYTPCIGRTHGIHADISSFGLKWVLWIDEMKRNLERFNSACSEVEVGKLSGAVGNYANINPKIEKYVCKTLGINSANISSQIVQRDNHAHYMSVLTLIASSLEKIALEVRNLQRTEVREVEEAFSIGQKGSSAMPHKKNPISSENICGCARVMRGYMSTFYENIALWHERDISHSSTERIILPDATSLIDYMLNRYSKVLDNLVVNEDQMLNNIYLTKKVIFSQRVMTKLIEKGMTREQAYDLIQPLALEAYNTNKDFQLLLQNKSIYKHLSKEEIDNCFTLEYYLSNVDYIYERNNIKEKEND